jgi:hypothetical protein
MEQHKENHATLKNEKKTSHHVKKLGLNTSVKISVIQL